MAWLALAVAGALIFWAITTNTFLSRMARIQDDRGHVVVTAGPYRYVRHPMYLGIIVLFLGMPVALGSWWALLPGAAVGLLFVLRTAKEDRMLREELPGYPEYTQRVRYRLLPGNLVKVRGQRMKHFILRPAEPEHDFGQLATWFSILEEETTTEAGLRAYYEQAQARITHQMAVDERGELLGFFWTARDRLQTDRVTFFLVVKPERRGQGIGRTPYENLEAAMQAVEVRQLRVSVWDNQPEDQAFAERRGVVKRSHVLAMALDLTTFDDRSYDTIIARLQGEGFQFTAMAVLGDTEEAQRKLYALNDTTDRETLGGDGALSWASFEDFQQRVCQADWYRPAGQMVAIDTATGDWAAMSAIGTLRRLRLQPAHRGGQALSRAQAGAGREGAGATLCPRRAAGRHRPHPPQQP